MNLGDLASRMHTLDRNPATADAMWAVLKEQIQDFERGLSPDEEVGACLAQFGHSEKIAIEGLSYRNSYLVVFSGTREDGSRCQLLQHVSQVNLLLVAVKARSEPARRIGFDLNRVERDR